MPRKNIFVNVSFNVSFKLPEGATREQAKQYVVDAVSQWHGSLQPPGADLGDGTKADGDPMFDLDANTVVVTLR